MSSECLRATFLLPLLVTLAPFLVAALTLLAYVRRPRWAGLPPAHPSPHRARELALAAAVFAAVAAVCAWKVAPHWRMQIDEERDSMMAALCATRRACPLVGNEMNRLRVQLGPLNRYLMAACYAVTPDPRLTLALILTLHALAAALAARVAGSLFGAPVGAASALALGAHPVLLETYVQPSNGSWVALPLVAAIWATLRWLRGDGGVPFLAAVTALVCAAQLHGTALEFAPVVAGLGLYYRPRTPRWALAAALGVAAVMYAPWLWFQLDSRWSGFRALSLQWIANSSPPGGPPLTLSARLEAPFRSVGPLALFAAPGLLALLADRDPARRGLLAFAVFPLAVSVAGAAASGGLWVDRYCVVFLPGLALAAFAWVRLLQGQFPRARVALGALPLAAVAWIIPATLPRLNNRSGALARSQTQVSLAEDIEAVRVLGAHGFRTVDLERRVHGKAWARWTSARTYLGRWLLPSPPPPSPPDHHVLVAECAVNDRSFTLWQRPLTRGPGRVHHLVGYRPSLGPARLEIDFGAGSPWAFDDAVPFMGQQEHMGDSELRRALSPELAYPRAFNELNLRRVGLGAAQPRARLRATLSNCPGDRNVTLLAPSHSPATLTVDGAPRAPDATLQEGGETRYRVHVPRAQCATAPVVIGAEFLLPPGGSLPARLDLYEEPSPGCPP